MSSDQYNEEYLKVYFQKIFFIYNSKKQLLIDVSTWLENEDWFIQTFNKWISTKGTMCFFIWDLNHLKLINDTIDHGEWALYVKTIAKILKQVFEKYGWRVFHPHWDEFYVIWNEEIYNYKDQIDIEIKELAEK